MSNVTACSSMCRVPHIEPPVAPSYEISHLKDNPTNSEIAKAVVISWRQCNDYNKQLFNLINVT